MKVQSSYFAALFSSLLLALKGKFPVLSNRRPFSTTMAVLLILIIVALGALGVYFIISSLRTSVYP